MVATQEQFSILVEQGGRGARGRVDGIVVGGMGWGLSGIIAA